MPQTPTLDAKPAKPEAKTNGLNACYAPVETYLPAVKEKLLAIVPPDSQLLAQSLHHSLSSGGKLLRPVVCLLASGACGGIEDKHLETAAVTELIHIATLLHDDVLDEADLRRGKETVRARWGNTVSILSGDYLLAQASRKLAQIGNIRVVAIFSDVLADLCDGEVEQIRTSYDLAATNWESYYRKSICKTATLFAAGCEAAGVLNGLPEAEVQSLRQFGESFGIAFQIVDDLLDYTASEAEMGKPVLDDLKNGLLNAPVLLALESERLTAEQRNALHQQIKTLFESNDETAATETVNQIQRMITEAGAIEQTQQLAQDFIQKAIDGLANLPESAEKAALVGLGKFVISRRK